MEQKASLTALVLEAILLLVNGEALVRMKDIQITGQTIEPFSGYQVHQYLGIRYAQPPVGELRFQKTAELRSFPKRLNAVNMPPACLQLSNRPYPPNVNGSRKSEDCLFLNIWTPVDASPRNLKAVLFWLHGGGFRFGSIQDPLYDGSPLTAIGDIIVVTVNYRVGALGFLSTGTDEAPGNAGLWDILEALKWVNKNIVFFGGDVTKITVAGESAGSIAVGYLSQSPLAVGLFSQQIMQSGSPQTIPSLSKHSNAVLTKLLARKVGCAKDNDYLVNHPRNVADCLKKVKADDLVRAEFEIEPGTIVDFLPQFGDEILPNNPRTSVSTGDFRCKKLMIGNNRDEGSMFLSTSVPEIFGFFGEKHTEMNRTVAVDAVKRRNKSWLPNLWTPDKSPVFDIPLAKDVEDTTSGFQQNILNGLFGNLFNSLRHELHTLLGDILFVCPDKYYAEKCAEKGVDVYSYLFVHRPSVTPWAKWMGVAHFEEVQFVFGQPLLHPGRYQTSEIELSREMITTWSNFVRTGKPSQQWPSFSKDNPVFKVIGSEDSALQYGRDLHKRNCELLRVLSAF